MKTTYLVEGMTCSGCERTVSKIIGSIQGVENAKADHQNSSVTVDYDASKVSIDDIRAAVSRVGYKFVGERPSHGQREGSDEAIS